MQKKLDVSSIEIPVGHVKADPAVGRRGVHSTGRECALYNGSSCAIDRPYAYTMRRRVDRLSQIYITGVNSRAWS